MSDNQSKLVPGELMPSDEREQQVRGAFEAVFYNGKPPLSVIIIADTGGKLRVSCVGPVADLRALALRGVPQLMSMLDNVPEPQEQKQDSSKLN